jgi:hypothetical protein
MPDDIVITKKYPRIPGNRVRFFAQTLFEAFMGILSVKLRRIPGITIRKIAYV